MMGGAVSRRLIGEFTPEELEIIEHPNRALMIKHGQRDKERENSSNGMRALLQAKGCC